MREHLGRAKRTATGMVAAIVLTMVEVIACANFGNSAIEYEALGDKLSTLTLKEIRKVGKLLEVKMRFRVNGKAVTKDMLIQDILTLKYGQGLSAPHFNFNVEGSPLGKMTDLDPSLQVDDEGQFIKADGILNPFAPMNDKIKSPVQRVPSFDYMDEQTKAKHRVTTNEAGEAVSRRYSASIKVPLLNPVTGQFKEYKDGRIKLVRHEMRVGYLTTDDEERYSGRVKTGSSNIRENTILRQVILENEEGAFLVWVAILRTYSKQIENLTMPNMVQADEVSKALEAVNTSWRFAAKVASVSQKEKLPPCNADSCSIDEVHICTGTPRDADSIGLTVTHPLDIRIKGNYSDKIHDNYMKAKIQAIKDANAWRTHTFSNGGE